MKVSLNWLKDYLDLSNITTDELFKVFSYHITELESAEYLCNVDNLVVGYVKECEEVEGTHLHKCLIEIKPGEYAQIVCGAPNMRQGVKPIVALPGAVLPHDFKIKPSKVHGIESNGMCCSLQELGIEEKYVPEEFKDGIYLLDEDAIVGSNPLEYLKLNDFVFELDLTANRSDLLSIEGVAYDLGANLCQKVEPKKFELKEVAEKNPVQIEVLTDKCTKYLTRTIKNVKIKKSPLWMRERLVASGIRPINNVVDITNYVLMELGQPLHSFDYDKLGNHIVVREANEGETIKTLDDIDRKLEKGDILITNGETPLCIAGIMGGASTEITDITTNVVLEAAYFEPLQIRKTSRRLDLKSESSTRFERTIDYVRVNRALDYAAYLLSVYADGEVLAKVNGVENKYQEHHVEITTTKINKVLGTSFNDSNIESMFDRYQYKYTLSDGKFVVTLPSRRMDLLESYQDIIEDVARLYGYDNIPTTLAYTNSLGGLTDKQRFVRSLRHNLSMLGLKEAINYSLQDEKSVDDFNLDPMSKVKILMPMTDQMSVMRHSLINALLKNINYNKAHKQNDLALFEIGKVYSNEAETTYVSAAFEGLFESSLWQGKKNNVDFFVVKGIVDTILSKYNFVAKYVPIDDKPVNFHPGRSAYIEVSGKRVGIIGEIHPRYAKEHDLNECYVFEINLDLLYSLKSSEFVYKSISKYPSVTRDLAIVLDKNISSDEVINVVKMVAKKNLADIKIFDVYTGENVKENEKSIALSLTLESQDKTLETEDIEKIVKSILNRLDALLHARLR